MPLSYYPSPGEILVCHYDDVVIEPEMTKTRPVVVVGPRLRRRGRLATVVPLSTTMIEPLEDYQCVIDLGRRLPAPFDAPVMWAKCDMLSSVSLNRLDRFREPRSRYGGPRRWVSGGSVSTEQLALIRRAIRRSLGFAD